MMTTNNDDGLIEWSFFLGGGAKMREKKSRKIVHTIVTVLYIFYCTKARIIVTVLFVFTIE